MGGAKVCPDCAEAVKHAARICRYCRYDFSKTENSSRFFVIDTSNVIVSANKEKNSIVFNENHRRFYKIVGVMAVIFIAFGIINDTSSPSNVETAKILKQIDRPNLLKITEESKEDRRKGLHCLSDIDGSNAGTVKAVKQQLSDPDSFQHIKSTIYPAVMLRHTLVMQFRSRNGFGGMIRGKAVADVNQMNCEAHLRTVS